MCGPPRSTRDDSPLPSTTLFRSGRCRMPPGFCGPRSLWSTLMLSRIVNRLEEGLIALLLGGMAMITFCQVVARYLFNSGAVWALELTTYLRSEEHTSELPSLMRNSYAVFCLKKKNEFHCTL